MPRLARFTLALLLVLLMAGGCGQKPSSAPTARPSGAAADSLLQGMQEQHAIPAMAAVVVRSDSIVAAGATGVRRQGRSARVSIRDRFHLGSNTKAMTATLAAVLVEQGALSWETTPRAVFPRLANAMHPAFRDVTLEQLLAHRAGLQPFTDMRELSSLPQFDGTPKEQRAAFSRYLLQREPAHEPGSTFVYSNAGYAVAAAMAEQVGGVSWEEMMRHRLFEPLNIDGGVGGPAAVDASQPWGHRERGGDTLRPHDPSGRYRLGPLLGPAGDVHMSMPDYGRFLQLHLRGLRGEETALLAPSTIQYMHDSKGPMTEQADGPGYGIGWGVQNIAGARLSGHAGSAGTFKARAAIQASRNLAVAVVANAGHEAADDATAALRDTLLERYRDNE